MRQRNRAPTESTKSTADLLGLVTREVREEGQDVSALYKINFEADERLALAIRRQAHRVAAGDLTEVERLVTGELEAIEVGKRALVIGELEQLFKDSPDQ